MPRHGKGQKVQTAQGQQYGQAKEQEEAQQIISLPQMQQPSPATMAPGSMAFAGRSQMPNEPVTAKGAMPAATPRTDPTQEFKVQQFLAVTSELVSQETASPWLRNAYRIAKSQVRDTAQFADKGLMPGVEDQ
ncbi:hypothetical protein [Hyphomonas sp.]|uniref:hypothetical protein n=1 Tax=Hyphomonas sp. TaxID=87 RepID=UPI000C97B00A|nr:hypothetical protein [Hyphomonas sp.]MAL46961.1 hypothetical protein [Hyphomonas sp.]